MTTTTSGPWRELVRFDDAHQARTIAVSIAAMEFPVRSVSVRTDTVVDWAALAEPETNPDLFDDDRDRHTHRDIDADAQLVGQIAIQVHPDHWIDLNDVLPDLIKEQADFDDYCTRRECWVGHPQRMFLMLLIVIVSILAAIGAIQV